ncbi:relaxase/mobilization nuclease domain-containing protein [Comamonas sp.]|uniref:relaxase/mobilization nuclease domain-containing protein n=1 Tax=Comamonas sp. TaxID=34028 RepID=UPI00289AFE76|nr:relaxase/mobilization nuclease domain-containing protein [Comamonas sp.]
MIIKIFKNVGKGSSRGPINYLLGNDAEGKVRSIQPRIFQGSKHATAFLIDNNHRQNKYTSGVVAFRDSENPSYEQLKEMCEDFQETFMPHMFTDDVPILWVLHREKGNTEMHFLIPKQTSKGKAFNAFPPGSKNMRLLEAWQIMQNDKLGYKQVTSDGFTQLFDVFEKKTRKPQFAKKIRTMAKTGKILNRNDLILFLNSQGHKVTRVGHNYISVKFSDKEKSMRFQGEIFKSDSDYKQLLSSSSKEKLSELDRAMAINTIAQLRKEREKYNLDKYHTPSKSKFQNTLKNRPSLIKKEASTSRLSSANADKQPSCYLRTIPNIEMTVAPVIPSKEKMGDSITPTLQERSEHAPTIQHNSFNFENFNENLSCVSADTSHQSSTSLAIIDSQIATLIIKLSSLKDPIKIAELQQKLAILNAEKHNQAFKEKHDKEKQKSRIKIR